MKKILIAVDGSEFSMEAVKLVKELSPSNSGNEIYILNVQNYTFPSEPYHSFGTEEGVKDLLVDRGKKVIQEIKKTFADDIYKTEILIGDTVSEILNYANKIEADLIVAGSHGKSGLTSLIMGSTTTKLLSLSPIPILVLKKSSPANVVKVTSF